MTKIIADLQRFQTPYNLIEIPEVQNYLNRSLQTIDTLVRLLLFEMSTSTYV